MSDDQRREIVERTWEVCSASKRVYEVWPELLAAIDAAKTLGLTWVSFDTERNDHFAHGGNVVKTKCVKYVLTMRAGVPDSGRSDGEADRG